MTATTDGGASELALFGFLIVVGLCALSLMVRGNQVKREQLRGVPLVFIPAVYCFLQIGSEFALRRRERVRAFLHLADHFRMRKKRVDGFLPRWPRR